MFCKKGTQLHAELREDWTVFTQNVPTAIGTYGHLFPGKTPASLKWVTFQQAVLKSRMPTITEDESRQVQEFIEARFKEDTNLRNNPWKALKVDEAQTDADLKKQYDAR